MARLDDSTNGALCCECARDPHLKAIIMEKGEPLECSVCEVDSNIAMSVDDLGRLIEPILKRHFRHGDWIPSIGDGDDDRIYHDQDGEDLSSIIGQVIGDEYSFHEKLVEAVREAEDWDPRDGGESYWESEDNYVEVQPSIGDAEGPWRAALDDLKNTSRFYSPDTSSLFESLFSDVEERVCRSRSEKRLAAKIVPVVRTLDKGRRLYRARVCRSQADMNKFWKMPMKELGPPPAQEARAGRMNAEGIVVLYSALSRETAVSELRPAIGQDVVSIEFRTTRRLRLLDFKRLERAWPPRAISYFHPRFDQEVAMSALHRRLHRLISMPVVPGRESDYLITQNLAEYLAHVHVPAFDGVVFGSAQRRSGVNVVLFASRNLIASVGESFGIKVVPNSLFAHRVERVKYKQAQHELMKASDGNVYPVANAMDEEDEIPDPF